MANSVASGLSRREAVQPSLWDRLVDDLPGLVSETEIRRAELSAQIGADRLTRLMAGEPRMLEQETDLDEQVRREVFVFLGQVRRRTFLEQRGIVVTSDVLREAVRRDMEELFSTQRLQARFLFAETERGDKEDTEDVISDFPHVQRSVLNYGVPSFSGRSVKDFDDDLFSKELREVVAVFEPRLKRDTIRVKVDSSGKAGLHITIEGVLLLSPVPERLRLSTTIDLDSGHAMTKLEEA
jgi:type VI secretion system protein ImpF